MKTQPRAAESGQTLIELLVVLAIFGLLAAIAAPQMQRYAEIGKENALKTQIATVSAALHMFYDDIGRFPTESEGLASLARQPTGITAWNGPYLSAKVSLQDPWGKALIYRSNRQGNGYDLLSQHRSDLRRANRTDLKRANEAAQ